MHVTVTGKQVDVGDALRRHVETSLDSLLGKYFRTAIEAHAVFTREAHLISADLFSARVAYFDPILSEFYI